MAKILLIALIFIVAVDGFLTKTFKANPKMLTHPELDNGEKWIDYISTNRFYKLYKLYSELDGVGIDFAQFDLFERPPTLHDVHEK